MQIQHISIEVNDIIGEDVREQFTLRPTEVHIAEINYRTSIFVQ